jgi:hypothetical protein
LYSAATNILDFNENIVWVISQALCGGAAAMLAPLSAAAAVAFCAGVAFVMFGCPLWLVRIQKYKQKINGNWDEAVPKWSSRVVDFQRQYSSAGASASTVGKEVETTAK